jgi:hypothetical protein
MGVRRHISRPEQYSLDLKRRYSAAPGCVGRQAVEARTMGHAGVAPKPVVEFDQAFPRHLGIDRPDEGRGPSGFDGCLMAAMELARK